jgi:hypothetical protein
MSPIRFLCLPFALLCAFGLGGCEASGAPPGFGLALDGRPVAGEAIDEAARATGWPVSLVGFFVQWPEDKAVDFPAESVRVIREAGAVPVISWEPMTVTDGEERAVAAAGILAGEWDGYIDAFARSARESGGTLIIRFAHEMNLARYHWGGEAADFGPQSPARYRAMFRHVRERFALQGASNALFAFCPNAESLPHPVRDGAAWNTVAAYYPGDDAVDVLGMDGYNWGTTFTMAEHGWDSRFTPFAEIFGPVRAELLALAPDKPLVVFETASVTRGGDKAAWVEDAVRTARAWGLAALCWFEVNKEHDWRLASGLDAARLRPLAATFAPDGQALALPVRAGGLP